MIKMAGLSGRAQALASAAKSLILDETSGGTAGGGGDDELETENGGGGEEENGGGENTGGGENEGGEGGDNDAGAPPPAAAGSEKPQGQAEEPNSSQQIDETLAIRKGRHEVCARIEKVFGARAEGKDGKEGELIVAGREQAAAELLAADLDADQVLKVLGKLPKGQHGDAMLETIRATAGSAPTLKPGSDSSSGNSGSSVWDRVAKNRGWDKDNK